MCASVLDGEDVVQETLAEAFYNLSTLKDASRFEAWMFRIAYYKCIDFLRRDQRRTDDVSYAEEHDQPAAADDDAIADAPVDDALAALVGALPPKERACVLLKDVLDYSLTEVAEIADSTLAGVKAALHRGRAKLRARPVSSSPAPLDSSQRRLFEAYAECFNRRDWDALKHLVRADARLEIVGSAVGLMSGLGSTYSGNYTRLPWEWRLSPQIVDGEMVLVCLRRTADAWTPFTAIRLQWERGHVVNIRDYIHAEYVLAGLHADRL